MVDRLIQRLEEMKSSSDELVEQELRKAVEEEYGCSFEKVAAVGGNAELLDQVRSYLKQYLETSLDRALAVSRCSDDYDD